METLNEIILKHLHKPELAKFFSSLSSFFNNWTTISVRENIDRVKLYARGRLKDHLKEAARLKALQKSLNYITELRMASDVYIPKYVELSIEVAFKEALYRSGDIVDRINGEIVVKETFPAENALINSLYELDEELTNERTDIDLSKSVRSMCKGLSEQFTKPSGKVKVN